MDKVPAKLLVDTCSAVTILHRRLWERGKAMGHLRKLHQLIGRPVVAANGQPLSILGQSKSKISLCGEEFSQELLIADDISQEYLLGADFCRPMGSPLT